MSVEWKSNPNLLKEIESKMIQSLDRASIILQNEIKTELSGPHSSTQLGVQSGTLRRSIQISKTDKFERSVGSNVVYAALHEFGGIISAKKADYLKFKIGNVWRTVKSVIIPARPFMRPALKKSKRRMLDQFKNIL